MWNSLTGGGKAEPPVRLIEPTPIEEDTTSRALSVIASQLSPGDSALELMEIEDRAGGDSNPQRGTILEYIGPNGAGVHVTHEKAWMTAAVWACMDVVASAIASSDWNLYEGIRGSDKKKTVLYDDQTQFLLNTRLNPEMTALSGKRALMLCALGMGNGYGEIVWDGAGRFAGLWPIESDRVTPVRNAQGAFVYRIAQDYKGGYVDLDPVDMFHVRGASLTGSRGDDAVARAIRTISMNIALDEFAASYYGNGTNLGGIITTKGKLDDEPFKKLQQRWSERHQGPRRAFRTGVLDGGATYTPLDSNAQKADLTNWKYQIIEEVCRWFRVPPHKIAHLLRATNNNIEHQGLEFTRDTLRPWCCEIEQEADYKLLSARGTRRFFMLDVDWASQGDYQSRATAFQTLLNTGVFTINQVLQKLGENTIGPAGDIRLVQGAMIPIELAGESIKTAAKVAAAPKPAPAPAPAAPGPAAPPAEPNNTSPLLLQAWLTEVYARAGRFFEKRQTQGSGARADAMQFLEEKLGPMRDFLVAHGDSEQMLIAATAGLEVVNGRSSPAEAAAAAIDRMTQGRL